MDQPRQNLEGIPKEHKDIWSRIISKRRVQWNKLSPTVVNSLAEAFKKIENNGSKDAIPATFTTPQQKLEFIIHKHFYRSIDDRIPALSRRFSWQCVQSMLTNMDQAAQKHKTHSSSDSLTSKNRTGMNREISTANTETIKNNRAIDTNSSAATKKTTNTTRTSTTASSNKTAPPSLAPTTAQQNQNVESKKRGLISSSTKANEHRRDAPGDEDDDEEESLRSWAKQSQKKKRRLSDNEITTTNKKGKLANNDKEKTINDNKNRNVQTKAPSVGAAKTNSNKTSAMLPNQSKTKKNAKDSRTGTASSTTAPKHRLMAERNPALMSLSTSATTGTTQQNAVSKKMNASPTKLAGASASSSSTVSSAQTTNSNSTLQKTTKPITIPQQAPVASQGRAPVSTKNSVPVSQSSVTVPAPNNNSQRKPTANASITSANESATNAPITSANKSTSNAQITSANRSTLPSARSVSSDSISTAVEHQPSSANPSVRTEKTKSQTQIINGNSSTAQSKAKSSIPAASQMNKMQQGAKQENASMVNGVHQTKKISQIKKYQLSKPVVLPETTISLFQADNSSPPLTGALSTRSVVRVLYKHHVLSLDDKNFIKERLNSWDPYWETVYEVMDRTSPLSSIELFQKGDRPRTALECDIQIPQSIAKLVASWGVPNQSVLQKYSHGQVRLILRMLPLSSEYSKKKKRADTHMWPKGTFLQVAGRPRSIVQRKQQSHDHSLWKNMSHACDLTSFVQKPCSSNKIQICCIDDEPYAISVAVCRYRSPVYLYKAVCAHYLKKLTHQQGIEKALQHINQSTVILDDEDESTEESNNSMTFSLTCPISKTIIETPVRGTTCKHWQCFDLNNFLQTSEIVSGGRWRCGVCEQFLSCKDLELCGFYTGLLEQFKGVAHPNRDRVQLFSNKIWVLMEETKLRYGNKKRPSNNASGTSGSTPQNGTNTNSQQEIIIL